MKSSVDSELEASGSAEIAAWKPELKTLDGDAMEMPDGPRVIVVSRIHHDGFNKYLPIVRQAQRRHEAIPVYVAFHQNDPEDASRRLQTRKYSQDLAIDYPVAVIGREEQNVLLDVLERRHKALAAAGKNKSSAPFNPYEPLTLFLTAEGKTLYLGRGALC